MEKVKAWTLAHRRIVGGVVLGVLLVVVAVLILKLGFDIWVESP